MASPTEEQIRTRAHQLWEQAGKPEGREEEFGIRRSRNCRKTISSSRRITFRDKDGPKQRPLWNWNHSMD